MTAKVCGYPGCEKKFHSRGLCQGHAVLDRRGEPLRPLRTRRAEKVDRKASRAERLWAEVVKGSECWEWQGFTDESGYGRMSSGGDVQNVQRIAYMEQVGEIPKGLIVKAGCGSKTCVRGEHLVLLDRTEAAYLRDYSKVSSSGYRNVYPFRGKWQVKFGIDRHSVYGGLYDTPEEAHEAAEQFRQKHGIVIDLGVSAGE